MSTDAIRVLTVVPTWQEAAHIRRCLTSLIAQDHPAKNHTIWVMDGGSTDGTRSIVEAVAAESLAAGGPKIELYDNTGRFVPHARNLALGLIESWEMQVDFMWEMIGHAWVEPNHLRTRLEALNRIEAKIGRPLGAIGGRVIANDTPSSEVERWVEAVLTGPLGGSGQFDNFSEDGETLIPAFALHRVSAVQGVGGWDESFLTSQDSVLSKALVDSNWPVWRTNTPIRMAKRDTLPKWWRMSHRYGFWRMKHLRKDAGRFRFREFLPLMGAISVPVLILEGSLDLAFGLVCLYLAVLLGLGVQSMRSSGLSSMLWGVPACLAILHTGFTVGLIDGLIRKGGASRDRA